MDRTEPLRYSELVDRLVPVFAELLLTLKIHDPLRVDISDLTDRTMLEFMRVLKSEEELTNEEIAVLIGRSLSAFYEKKKRLESERVRPSDLQSVYEFVAERSRQSVRAVREWQITEGLPWLAADRIGPILRYLVRYGLLSSSRAGRNTEYRRIPDAANENRRTPEVLLALHSGPLSLPELVRTTGCEASVCGAALGELRESGVLKVRRGADGVERYSADHYLIGTDEPSGWHTAVWVHLNAVCRAIVQKVRRGEHQASGDDRYGGTTFQFDVPKDDPLFDEITGFLASTRVQMDAWLERVRALPTPEQAPDRSWTRVVIYTGQTLDDLDP